MANSQTMPFDAIDGPMLFGVEQAVDGIAGMFTVRRDLTQKEVDSVIAAWRKRYGERALIGASALPYTPTPASTFERYRELLNTMLDAYKTSVAEPYRHIEKIYNDATDAFCAFVLHGDNEKHVE